MDIDSVVFYTNNIERVKDFYLNILGFPLEYEQAGKYISFVFPSGIRLGIKLAYEPREIPGSQTVFIQDKDIDNHYNALRQKGVAIYKELADESWGKNFSILDPDGNKVQFVQRHS